jgi:hypothetical protein
VSHDCNDARSGASSDALVVLVANELDDDVLLRLDLQHLQDETDEVRGLVVGATHAADMVQLDGAINKRLGCRRHDSHGQRR